MTDFLKEWDSDADFVSAHTSGSTGSPKPIRLLKEDMTVSALNTIRFFGLGPDSVLAVPLSAEYIAGKMMAVRARLCGGRLVELPVSNQVDLPERTDLLAIVPSQIDSVLNLPKGRIGSLLIGGSPMTVEQERRVADSGIPAWIGYGMTETCSHVALRRVGGDGVYRSVSPEITFETDPDGCLVITSELFSWRRLITRDVVRLLSPAEFVWLGRADNAINSGGIKIHPEQLETEIRSSLPQLPPFFIIGEPHPKWGESLVMVVESESPIAGLAEKIALKISDRRHTPRKILFTQRLVRTSNGKIKRIPPKKYIIS